MTKLCYQTVGNLPEDQRDHFAKGHLEMGQQFAILLNQIIQLGVMKNQDVEMSLKQLAKFDFEPNDAYITKLYTGLLKQL
jgi:hypothetical protein